MKLHFMREEALTYFKENVRYNISDYLNKDYSWIYEKYTAESPLLEFKLDVPEFIMDINSDKPESTDYNNVKILYEGLKNLTDTQASDERFWVGLCHSDLWEFVQYRCKLSGESISESKVRTNFFINKGQKRGLILNPISRLWWVGRLIYDEKAHDPYYALEYMKNDFGTKVLSLFSSNYTNNPKITRSILTSISDIEAKGKKVSRNEFLEIIRYVNLLGGVVILDYLTEEELKSKIKTHYFKVNINAALV